MILFCCRLTPYCPPPPGSCLPIRKWQKHETFRHFQLTYAKRLVFLTFFWRHLYSPSECSFRTARHKTSKTRDFSLISERNIEMSPVFDTFLPSSDAVLPSAPRVMPANQKVSKTRYFSSFSAHICEKARVFDLFLTPSLQSLGVLIPDCPS